MSLEGKTVVFVIAWRGFRDEELLVPSRLLLALGARTRVASSALGDALGVLGARIPVDLLYTAIRPVETDALVLVGGEGATEFFDDRAAHGLVREVLAAGRVVGAICFAGSTLANAGVLEGRAATAFPTRAAHLRAKGARWSEAGVVRDGRLITAQGPESSEGFGKELIAALSEMSVTTP